jgi:hypothetical protein
VRAKVIAALLAATAIVGAVAAPGGASAAKPQRNRTPASVSASVQGPGAGGFEYIFGTLGSRGDFLWLTQRPDRTLGGSEASVVYFVTLHGREDFHGDRLDAKVGGLGHFRGRFVPGSTKLEQLPEGCTGEPTTTEKGVFVGSFVFRGERGYTRIDARRERGRVVRQGAMSCPASNPSGHRRHRSRRLAREERERRQNEFRLLAGDPKGGLSFQAEMQESAEVEEGSPTTIQASMTERVGRLEISRNASSISFGADAAATFQVPDLAEPLSEATLTPPAPFSGSATFHLDEPRSATWSGDLAVELPGAGEVPLTGKGIAAGLCHGPSHCTKTLPEPLQRELDLGPGFAFYGAATTEPAK